MRQLNFSQNEVYHLCSRGAGKKNIFLDDEDRARFLFLILHLQSPTQIHNTFWYTNKFLKKRVFPISMGKRAEISKSKIVDLISFVIMGNHFHLMVQSLTDVAISVYMQRVLTAYSKYFNKKYSSKGHVFDGPFGAVHIDENTQLLHTSAYIHKNPKDLGRDYEKYEWSSFIDFTQTNRWADLLNPDLVLDQFKQKKSYSDFVSKSTAKESIIL